MRKEKVMEDEISNALFNVYDIKYFLLEIQDHSLQDIFRFMDNKGYKGSLFSGTNRGLGVHNDYFFYKRGK